MDIVFFVASPQLEYLGRVFLAALCGAAIGYERENRMKLAGIRTHLIVAIGSSLMMIVSKYGFYDMLAKTGIGLDPSRIAAGVITSIGFLGAGVIFVRDRHTVSGITTAAGLWATVGVGIAIGAGMYPMGIGASALILLFQFLLHKNTKLIREPVSGVIVMSARGDESVSDLIQKLSTIANLEITGLRISRTTDGEKEKSPSGEEQCPMGKDGLELRINVKCPRLFEPGDMLRLLEDIPNIKSVEI